MKVIPVLIFLLLAATIFAIRAPSDSNKATRSTLALSAAQVSAAQPGRALVPAGTEILVRLIDGINASTTAAGEVFRASVDDPVIVGNRVIIPRNADATVQVVK